LHRLFKIQLPYDHDHDGPCVLQDILTLQEIKNINKIVLLENSPKFVVISTWGWLLYIKACTPS